MFLGKDNPNIVVLISFVFCLLLMTCLTPEGFGGGQLSYMNEVQSLLHSGNVGQVS
jgi:hypothetical protein